jgi:hypothetical protein
MRTECSGSSEWADIVSFRLGGSPAVASGNEYLRDAEQAMTSRLLLEESMCALFVQTRKRRFVPMAAGSPKNQLKLEARQALESPNATLSLGMHPVESGAHGSNSRGCLGVGFRKVQRAHRSSGPTKADFRLSRFQVSLGTDRRSGWFGADLTRCESWCATDFLKRHFRVQTHLKNIIMQST